jgi:protein SCO1/2
MMISIQKKIHRSVVFACLLFLAACQAEQPWATSNMTGALPNLSFNLTEANHKKTVTAEDYQGKIVMLFFGFTHCPAVCPTTLLHLQKTLLTLGEKAEQIRVLFVTVDPERDGLDELKQYTENFGPQVIGLRGNASSLNLLTKNYAVSHENQKADAEGNYDIAHGSAVYVFDRKGTMRLLVRANDSSDAITSDLKRLLNE